MLIADSVKTSVLLKPDEPNRSFRLERKKGAGGAWQTLTEQGFSDDRSLPPRTIKELYLDEHVSSGIYQYRIQDINTPSSPYEYSLLVRAGETEPIGYTFGNYHVPEGQWGEILTPDDLHYTYLWGVDLRASNGQPYTDSQIRYSIDAALREVERRLNITIKKTRIACEPHRRSLKRGIDYDEEESFYTFREARVRRQGFIPTRKRPIIAVSKLDLLSRTEKVTNLLDAAVIDKTKGLIRFFNTPFRASDSLKAVSAALAAYSGYDGWQNNLFYSIDYTAGYETSDEVPADLRAVIAKVCAVELLNIIGDGLMSGFSSSSLSMDGVSESFSSTQSATSAYYGARIKVYEDEIKDYISENKHKFGHVVMGTL